jgi:hypothetical protein
VGRESDCVARWAGEESSGSARLETDHVAFRGTFRVRMPFAELRSVDLRGGTLVLTSGRGALELDLGPAEAKAWEGQVARPKPLLDKLGVKPGARVAVLGVRDEDFMALLQQRTGEVFVGRTRAGCDLIFYQADRRRDLGRLATLRRALQPAGAIWVVSPRGDPGIRDVDVIAAAIEAGLVDTKVVRFSDTHTSLKLVIPKALRPKG